MKRIWDGPSREERDEITQRVSELLPGTPAWALFLRWPIDQRSVYVEASSHSRLATVDLDTRTIVMSDRLADWQHGGQTVSF